MQICTLLQTDNHAISPPLSFSQTGCPSCHPTNSVKALKVTTLCWTICPNFLTVSLQVEPELCHFANDVFVCQEVECTAMCYSISESAFHDEKLTEKMPLIRVETLNMARYVTHSSNMQVQDIFYIKLYIKTCI